MHAVDNYGLSEVIGPGVASECVEPRTGCMSGRITFDPEIVDPETGGAARRRAGELVFTTLTKEASRCSATARGTSRPDARHRAPHAPHRADQRPHGRHDDRARGQRLPDPDRGDPAVRTTGFSAHYLLELGTGRPARRDAAVGRGAAGQRRPGIAHGAGRRCLQRTSARPSASASRSWSATRARSSARPARPGASAICVRRSRTRHSGFAPGACHRAGPRGPDPLASAPE